jgi:predicted DNA-binding transcriptional regulator YafY
MRRADRLFLLINALQGRRTALPARRLAETLGVSLRTVYRDVADLQGSGVPIEGEAGVGYLLRKGADIPPLMFTPEELEALVVGVRFVRAFAGGRLAQAAQLALLKIEAALPESLRGRAERTRVFAPGRRWHEVSVGIMDRLHAAIEKREVLVIDYRDEAGVTSSRAIEPLCLAFWGGVWTVGAWCRLRTAFRNFRLDRIAALGPAGERFEDSPERGLQAFLREMQAGDGRAAKMGRKGAETIKPV